MPYKSKPSEPKSSRTRSTSTAQRVEAPQPSRLQESLASQSGRHWAVLTVIVLTVVAVVAAGLLVWSFKADRMNPYAYQNHLVSVSNGDLPAPPFIGWEQSYLGTPPKPLKPDETITNVNEPECEPGGERQRELDWLIMDNATKWSGTEMFNAAYNSMMRVDASNAFVESNKLDYGVVDRWLQDCSYVQFDQEDRTVRITYTPLDVDMSVWNFDDGRAWVQTVATTTPSGYQGASSTITTLGNAPGITMRANLTFRGRVDDNAINTMDLLWSTQAAKAKTVMEQNLPTPNQPVFPTEED